MAGVCDQVDILCLIGQCHFINEMINMNIANPRACVIGGRVVKQVEKFKYLGTLLSMDGLSKMRV